jgi:hypothetical protein
VAPVTIRQMFSFKTTVEGNARNFYKWFFGIAVPANVLNYVIVVTTHSHVYRSTAGIWLESAIDFVIFMASLIIANLKSARLSHPEGESPD